jgi:hypothetical protein
MPANVSKVYDFSVKIICFFFHLKCETMIPLPTLMAVTTRTCEYRHPWEGGGQLKNFEIKRKHIMFKE